MTRLYLPARDPRAAEEEWRAAVGGKWKSGHSAQAFAYTWFGADPCPREVAKLFEEEPRLAGWTPLIGLVEHETRLVGRGQGSHSDALLLFKLASGELGTMAVEAKVSEQFGNDNIEDWLGAARDENRQARMEDLCHEFDLTFVPELGPIRYQLFHRTAAALKEARRFNASHAVMLVHSFSKSYEWLDDFLDLARCLGASDPQAEVLTHVGERRGVQLWLGWVTGRLPEVAR